MGNDIKGKVKHRNHRVLYLSGLYKQKVEKSIKEYRRNDKHRGKNDEAE